MSSSAGAATTATAAASVWVQSRKGNVHSRLFKVNLKSNMDFYDLKKAIRIESLEQDLPIGAIACIYSADNDNEDSILQDDVHVPVPGLGEIGSSIKHPYFYSLYPKSGLDAIIIS